MSLKIITVGDKTDHGGTVISGSPTTTSGGKQSLDWATKSIARSPTPAANRTV
jgi:uncharacterized Zn-binding protein involved in type VI secretion